MTVFETDKKPLLYLLDRISQRELALPDFQRSFVWDPGATRELVASIIRSFPAGNLLFLKGGAKVFAPREVEGAPTLNGSPNDLVLDGQQRLTSLYQAFSGVGTHRFFLNIQELLDGLDVDDAVEVYPLKRAKLWARTEDQGRTLMLPLYKVRNFADWRDEVLDVQERVGQDIKKLKSQLNDIERQFIKPIEQYQFPVTTLSESTPVEAVCSIFETLNRTGVKLSPFELITARAFAHDVPLRDLWSQALDEHPILGDFDIDPYYVLQVVAMCAKRSSKRSSVLGLEIKEMMNYWDRAIRGLVGSLTLLRDECGVLVGKWLGYYTMLITLGTSWEHVAATTGPAVGERRAKVKRFFWCSAFSGTYENSPNSRTEADVPSLTSWLEGGAEPAVVSDFAFPSERWCEVSYRQRGLYRTTIALSMAQGPRDFHEASPLTKAIIDGAAVDDHHIFPKKYLANQNLGDAVDSVLNHTLIDKVTNIRIGKRAPSDYLTEMRHVLKDDFETVLRSHGLPADEEGPLLRDDFEGFLRWRQAHMSTLLSAVTGGRVT